jgi:sterol 3beta-glucosyltransferase
VYAGEIVRITVLTVGSRGDVQPFVALAMGLQRAGYKVQLATEHAFEAFVSEHGLEFAPLRAEFVQLAQSDKGKAALSGKKSLRLIREVMPMLRNMLDDAWEAAKNSDIIIYHPKSMAGEHIAEKLDIPCFLAMVLPALSPTRAFSNPAFGGRDYSACLNKMSYTLMVSAMFLPYRRMINQWRDETLGMPPGPSDLKLHGQPIPKLYGYSQHVLPPAPDWDDTTHVTGYWFLPSSTEWQAPLALLTFLEAGPAPIYVGFGSMVSQDAERLTRKVLLAARETGQRVLLATGWGGLATTELPGYAYTLHSVPHDWLFPRCAAVIHHGGAGTTGTGLRAGKPTLVCPFFGDQPFWGQRVYELGVGPQPIPQRKLTAENLAQAMRQLTDDEVVNQKAQALGEQICSEDGVAEAIEVIRNYL